MKALVPVVSGFVVLCGVSLRVYNGVYRRSACERRCAWERCTLLRVVCCGACVRARLNAGRCACFCLVVRGCVCGSAVWVCVQRRGIVASDALMSVVFFLCEKKKTILSPSQVPL